MYYQLHTAMFKNITYNNVKDEIVKLLTSPTDLKRYVINKTDLNSAEKVFSRNTKFSLENMLAFMIMPRTESTSVELKKFAIFTGQESVCKHTFFKKRKQLDDSFLDEINHRWNHNMYLSDVVLKKWHNLYLFAFDGSMIRVPDTEEIERAFGKGRNQFGINGTPLASLEVVRDILNGNIYDIEIGAQTVSEHMNAKSIIERMPKWVIEKILCIFDRGYIGAALFLWLNLSHIQYLIRLPRGFNKEVDSFFTSKETEADVCINMSAVNWLKKGKRSFERFGLDPQKCPPVMLHLVKCVLSSDEVEVLAMRINGEIPSAAEVRKLYGMRWAVETTIDELKNQLQLEVFSGNSVLSVKQDIKSKVIAYNIGTQIANCASAEIEEEKCKNEGHKCRIHKGEEREKVNLNIAWYYLKELIVKLMLYPPDKIDVILTETVNNIKKSVEVYKLDRHLPHSDWTTPFRGKYITYLNYKRAL